MNDFWPAWAFIYEHVSNETMNIDFNGTRMPFNISFHERICQHMRHKRMKIASNQHQVHKLRIFLDELGR